MSNSPSSWGNRIEGAIIKFATKILPALLLSVALFAGGIAILALRIPGWSLIFGLPAVQIGIVFLIFTFDEIARSRVGPNSLWQTSCSVCGKPTLLPSDQQEEICQQCRQKIAKRLKKEV